MFPVSLLLLLAWGALAMGGAPSWAAAPIAVFSIATGILGFLERPQTGPALSNTWVSHWPVVVGICLCLAAIGAQLVPLAESTVHRLSPARDVAEFERLLAAADRRDPELVVTTPADAPRPLSIAPTRTWLGLGFVACFSLLLVGTARGLSAVRVSTVARGVAILGVVVAMLGLYQAVSGTAVIYGLYQPIEPKNRSAPFVNRNHQAGWLVMVLCLTFGSFAGEVARSMRGVRPHLRERILWFSSKEASLAILQLFASLLMAIGVLTTQARSGAMMLIVAFTMLSWWGVRRQSSGVRRGVMTIGVIAVASIAAFTSGSGVVSRMTETSGPAMGGRLEVWQDSIRILKDFWLTGTGFNTYGTAMLHYRTVDRPAQTFIEAHNDYLQLAVEGGLLIGVPVLMLFASVCLSIWRRFREGQDDTRTYWIRVGAVVGLVAILAQSLVEFTLQMPGAAAMFATLLAIAMHQPRSRSVDGRLHER